MSNCDHTVGWEGSEYDGTSWMVHISEIDTFWRGIDIRFSFCPECGASLADFWETCDGR